MIFASVQLWTTLASIFGVAGIAGTALAVFYANVVRTTIATYKDDNDALRGRVQTLEDESKRKDAEIIRVDAEASLAKADITRLTELVTQRAAVEAVAAAMGDQHAAILGKLNEQGAQQVFALNAVTEAVKNLPGAIKAAL